MFGHGFDKLVYILLYSEGIQNSNCRRLDVFFLNKRVRFVRADKAVALQYHYK